MSFNPRESTSVCEHGDPKNPTLVEINIHEEKGKKRSKSRSKQPRLDPSFGGPANFGVLGSNGQSVEDNFRNQLIMTSLNDEFIEQWQNESKQNKEEKQKSDEVKNKLKSAQKELEKLKAENCEH